MANLSNVLLFLIFVLGGKSLANEKNEDGLDSLQHLQSEAQPDQIQGIPDDLKGKIKPMKFTTPQPCL